MHSGENRCIDPSVYLRAQLAFPYERREQPQDLRGFEPEPGFGRHSSPRIPGVFRCRWSPACGEAPVNGIVHEDRELFLLHVDQFFVVAGFEIDLGLRAEVFVDDRQHAVRRPDRWGGPQLTVPEEGWW